MAFADAGHASLDAGEPVTGDSANITLKVEQDDDGTRSASNDTNPTETEDGQYVFDLTQAETNGDKLTFYPESSTAGVQVVCMPSNVLYTRPPNFGDTSISATGVVNGSLRDILGSAITGTAADMASAFSTFWDVSNNAMTVNSLSRSLGSAASQQAQGGTSSTIQLATAEVFGDTDPVGCIVKIFSGTGRGQTRVITAYTSATDTATVSPDWNTTPDSTSLYQIMESVGGLIGSPSDLGGGTSTLAANLSDMAGGTFDNSTDSLEALRDRGDAAWLTATGFSTHSAADVWTEATRTLTGADNITSDNSQINTASGIVESNLQQVLGTTLTETNSGDLANNISFFYDVNPTTTNTVDDVGGSGASAADIADAVWDEAQADHTSAGSFGEIATEIASILVDTDSTIPTLIGTPVADLATDIAGVQSDTDDIQTSIGTINDLGGGADIANNLQDIAGATFATATDSLEAIRNRGDSSWVTGGGGSDRLLMVDTTIATLASQTSFTLTAGSTDDDAYNGCTIVVEDVSTSTQKAVGIVDSYTGSTKTITLLEDPGVFTMAATDKVYILAEKSIKPTTAANYHVDVTANGNVGIDWGNIDNATTVVDLSGTDINLVDTTTTNTDMRGTDNAALATVCTEARLAELDAANLPADVDSIQLDTTAILEDTGTTLPATLSSMDGKIDTVDSVVDIIAVDTADMQPKIGTLTDLGGGATLADNLSDIAGSGFVSSTDSNQAIRDRGDVAWITGAGGGGDATEAKQDTIIAALAVVDGNVDSVLTDTGTDIPNTLSTIESKIDTVDGIVDDILVDTGTTLPTTLGTPTDTDLATDIANVQTDTTAILADTNELQTDWKNGGRLDVIVDAILEDTNELQQDWEDGGRLDLLLDDALELDADEITADACNKIADHIIRRTLANARASSNGDTVAFRSLLGAASKLVNKVDTTTNSNKLTVFKEDDVAQFGTQTLVTDDTALPIVEADTD